MQDSTFVYTPPVRENIAYYVGINILFGQLLKNLKVGEWIKTLIFCRSYNDIKIHEYFIHELGNYSTQPKGSPNYVKYWVIDIFTHCTHSSVTRNILEQFTQSSSCRVIIATVAFGMGVDSPNIRQVIHWGIPEDAEMYIQESGRTGRDNKPAHAIIVKHPRDLNLKHTTQQMIV